MNIAQVIMRRQPSTPKPLSKRRFAEDCQYGDEIEWAINPRVRLGTGEHDGPSRKAVVTMRIGSPTPTVFVRFFIGDRLTLPFQVVAGQAVVVRSAR